MSDTKQRFVWDRRTFIKRAAVAAAAPLFIPSSALGLGSRPAPSNRVQLAVIGSGGMGGINAANMVSHPAAQFVEFCDVDQVHADAVATNIENYYSIHRPGPRHQGIRRTGDFRETIKRDDVDAVVIATPDHWHAIIAIAAMNAGKDVFGEKPLTLTIGEGIEMVKAVRRTGRVFQHGTQCRSMPQVQRAVELVRNGRIGKLQKVLIGCTMAGAIGPQPEMPVPDHFDYDMWLGPAPWAYYTAARCHANFRNILDYSGGSITDLGTHYCDVANWGSDKQLTGPVEIEGAGAFPSDGLYNVAVTFDFTCRFADGLVYEASTNYDWGWGVRWIGEEGWIHLPLSHPVPPSPTTASDPRILDSVIRPHEYHVPASDNHWHHFIDCVLARKTPVAPIEIAHRSVSIPHLANLAMQLQRKLRWDPDAERFVNDAEANERIYKPYRGAWSLT